MSRFAPILLTIENAEAVGCTEAAMAATLNGGAELWHPALLPSWSEAPSRAYVSDHLEPKPGVFYVVPDEAGLGLPENWRSRAEGAGSQVVSADPDRGTTRRAFFAALRQPPTPEPPPAFFGLGFGCMLLEQLSEAMGHGNPLNAAEFWRSLQLAASLEAGDAQTAQLKAAADLLRAARDVLYPSTLHLIDLALLDSWPVGPLPSALRLGAPVNLLLSAATLQRWASERPDDFAAVKNALDDRTADLCGGHLRDQPDALLHAETQFANLREGWRLIKELTGHEPAVHARARFGASPQWPELASALGQRHALLHSFDVAAVPTFKGSVLEWPSPTGKSLQAFLRTPAPSENAQTWFRLAQRLHETILQDFSALLFQFSRGPEPSWQVDWLALHQLAPVFGQPATFSAYFSETYASDHPPSLPADDFRSLDLEERCRSQPEPISGLAVAERKRSLVRSAAAGFGMLRGLPRPSAVPLDLQPLGAVEAALSHGKPIGSPDVESLRRCAAEALAGRLLLRATEQAPGHLVFNTCSFARRALVDLPGVTTPLPSPARATQLRPAGALASVELPPFGFAWLPLAVSAGAKIAQPKHPIAEHRRLRNEHLDVELDESTGGIREFRDSVRKIGRLGLQLVHASGSRMRLRELKLESAGPAVGCFVASGDLDAEDGAQLAEFKLTYELGWGLPYLKVRVDLTDKSPPQGPAWSDHYALRIAWPDPNATLCRSLGWGRAEVKCERFEAAAYFEVASGPVRTALLTGGLPFVKRHGVRMADLLLAAKGEACRSFEIALAADREAPALTAEDWLTPPLVVPVLKGPPPGGPWAWLFDLDSAHVLVASLRPEPSGADAVLIRLVESLGVSGEAQLRCPRHPVRAEAIDERGELQSTLTIVDDTVFLHFAPFESVLLRLVFSP